MYYSKKSIQQLCEQNSISLKKRWGQNFLFHRPSVDKVIKTIVACYDNKASTKDITNSIPVIWEIGPGLAALSAQLFTHTKKLCLFEIDYGIISILEKMFTSEIKTQEVEVIAGDAAKTLAIYEKQHKQVPSLICGNLPYSTGMRILIDIIACKQLRVPMCIILQTEAVERLCAKESTKDYAINTVLIQSMYDVKMCYKISRDSFYPYAYVDSSVCVLTPKKNESFYNADDTAFYTLKRIVKIAFSSRRKQLKNTLYPVLQKEYKNIDHILQSINFDITKRPEDISVKQYCCLVDALIH